MLAACPLAPIAFKQSAAQRNDAVCHVWTAPSWQGLSSRAGWSVQPCVRPFGAVHMTAGHNALRGSGPNLHITPGRCDLVRPLTRPGSCTAHPWPSWPRPFGRVYWQARPAALSAPHIHGTHVPSGGAVHSIGTGLLQCNNDLRGPNQGEGQFLICGWCTKFTTSGEIFLQCHPASRIRAQRRIQL